MIKNELGNRYGKLVVIEDAGKDNSNHKIWKCQCDCGNEITVRGSRLRNGEKTDCGCVKKHGFVDETGNRYGRLTVIEPSNKKQKSRKISWVCKCDCGNITTVSGGDLRNGKTQSCGCLMNESKYEHRLIDETGKKYGKLTVIERVIDNEKNRGMWKCRCDCGNYTLVNASNLRNGVVQSCGCVKSRGEQLILALLQKYNIPYKKEYCFIDLVTKKGGHPRFDFGIFNDKGLAFLIEYQGIQHYVDKGAFGKEQRENTDTIKKEYCQKKNIPLYEIKYDEDIKQKIKEICLKELNINIDE